MQSLQKKRKNEKARISDLHSTQAVQKISIHLLVLALIHYKFRYKSTETLRRSSEYVHIMVQLDFTLMWVSYVAAMVQFWCFILLWIFVFILLWVFRFLVTFLVRLYFSEVILYWDFFVLNSLFSCNFLSEFFTLLRLSPFDVIQKNSKLICDS